MVMNMAHYAFLDADNIVTEVISGRNENENNVDWEQWYGEFRGQICKRTSYNTIANEHPEGRPFRKNYAGIGYKYDAQRDAFIPPQPFLSWILDENTCIWSAPVSIPVDGKLYQWDENILNWVVSNG